jgi:hypothetical protein
MVPPFDLEPFPILDRRQLAGGHTGDTNHVVVEHLHSTLADRAHPELGLVRDTELPHHDDVERGLHDAGDFVTDGHSAAWQRSDDRVGAL